VRPLWFDFRMTVAYVSFVVGIVVVALAGALVWRFAPAHRPVAERGLTRLTHIRETCRDELGDHVASLVIILGCVAAAVAVSWPVGRFARRFQPHIDVPFLRWSQRHTTSHGTWHAINAKLTLMGNRPEIKVICIVAAVVFALLWIRRGWWKPVLIIAGTFGLEKMGQMVLKLVVDRSKPDLPGFGAYPSGGVARLITVYGMVFFLVLLTWPRISRSWRVAGFTAVGVLAFVEAYTRLFLIKHWGMDVVGGLLYGSLLLLGLMAAASCFGPRPQRPVDDLPREAIPTSSSTGAGPA
jgi:membrane-associated phospholipid phosphatase